MRCQSAVCTNLDHLSPPGVCPSFCRTMHQEAEGELGSKALAALKETASEMQAS